MEPPAIEVRRLSEGDAAAFHELRLHGLRAQPRRVYARRGYEAYGREPRTVKVGREYLDELLISADRHPQTRVPFRTTMADDSWIPTAS